MLQMMHLGLYDCEVKCVKLNIGNNYYIAGGNYSKLRFSMLSELPPADSVPPLRQREDLFLTELFLRH